MWTTFCLCPLIPSCSVACEFLILFHKHTLLAEVCLTGSHSPVAWGKWQRLMNWLCRPPASPGIPSSACHGYLDLFLEGCLLSKHLLEPFGRSLWLRRVCCAALWCLEAFMTACPQLGRGGLRKLCVWGWFACMHCWAEGLLSICAP